MINLLSNKAHNVKFGASIPGGRRHGQVLMFERHHYRMWYIVLDIQIKGRGDLRAARCRQLPAWVKPN